mmetsp:Transcript_108732/g.313960  ORF Transcript_108732/g.313960 Transcript_108732/m.313960 type:complete len:365 (+) Transcript_108732:105-1199(+)
MGPTSIAPSSAGSRGCSFDDAAAYRVDEACLSGRSGGTALSAADLVHYFPMWTWDDGEGSETTSELQRSLFSSPRSVHSLASDMAMQEYDDIERLLGPQFSDDHCACLGDAAGQAQAADEDAEERLINEFILGDAAGSATSPLCTPAAPMPPQSEPSRPASQASAVLSLVVDEEGFHEADGFIDDDLWVVHGMLRHPGMSPTSSGHSVERSLSTPLEADVSRRPESGYSSSLHTVQELDDFTSTPGEDDGLLLPRLDLERLLALSAQAERMRLSSDEARGLPKVRFEAPELQKCSICLEFFGHGMLLTGLSCGHVFHVDCLSRWVQCSAQCPNCRCLVEPCAMATGRSRTPHLSRSRSASRHRA